MIHEQMTITEVINFITQQPNDTYFEVPADSIGTSTKHVAAYIAPEILRNYHHAWKTKGEETTFNIWKKQEDVRVWIPSKLEHQYKTVISIGMTNPVLEGYYSNMNTIGD